MNQFKAVNVKNKLPNWQKITKNTLRCLIEGWGRLLNFGFFSDPGGAY